MSDRIVLRRVYALDPNTGGFIPAGNSIITDGRGGTTWSGVLDSISTFGGPMVSFLPSTLSSFSTLVYINTSNVDILQRQLSNTTATVITAGLGTLGYISSLSLQSSITSTVAGLGNIKYVSSSWLESSIIGLGSLGYVSTITSPVSFQSTVTGLGSSGYVSTIGLQTALQSTVTGLGSRLLLIPLALLIHM